MAANDLPTNLRRLFMWHHVSNRDAARVLGASEHAVSGWLTGKRPPGGRNLLRLGELYGINPARLWADPLDFGQDIADRKRTVEAEERVAEARAGRLGE